MLQQHIINQKKLLKVLFLLFKIQEITEEGLMKYRLTHQEIYLMLEKNL